MDAHDTIAAIATPRGDGGVGIVRVSGNDALAVVSRLTPPALELRAVPSHTVHHAWLRDANGRVLDETLVTVMRAPRTFTGEDVVEIGVHGGDVTARRVLDAVLDSGARLADPGEFTKRSFLNGRIDLSQAEAVSDLVAARTNRAAESALAGLSGRLSARTRRVEEALLDLLARLELNLDFQDSVEAVDRAAVGRSLADAARQLEALGERAAWGRRLREGALVVLTGEPNVGKSSLFNALLEDDRALVATSPGTTRDFLEAWIDVGGVPVRLVDTAGLRDADGVEAEGVRRAREMRDRADVRLDVVDVSAKVAPDAASPTDPEEGRDQSPPTLRIGNKSDLRPGATAGIAGVDVLVSALNGNGLTELRERLAAVVAAEGARWEGTDALPGERHADAIRRSVRSLDLAGTSWRDGATEELIAGDVRDATEALGEISGRTVNEEVLDRIFRRFCIGK